MKKYKRSIYRIDENLFIQHKNDKEIKFFIRFLKDNFIYSDFIKEFNSVRIKKYYYGHNIFLYNFIHNILIASSNHFQKIAIYRNADIKLNEILSEYKYENYNDIFNIEQKDKLKRLEPNEIKKYAIYLG